MAKSILLRDLDFSTAKANITRVRIILLTCLVQWRIQIFKSKQRLRNLK